jgi:hypothetical protein
MIQTRKVQYQCMSKLSPQELASRAHHFLGEGNRRSTGHQKNSDISTSNTGISMHNNYYDTTLCA